MRRPAVAVTVALAALTFTASEGRAAVQHARDSLVAGGQAYDQGNFERAAALLSYGLDPGAGPEDSVWVVSLHKLGNALIEMDRAPLATLWLRWALRHHGRLEANDIDFPPALFSAFADAAQSVQRVQNEDSLVDTRWEWPEGPAPISSLGALRVTTNADSVQPVDVALTVSGLLTLGHLSSGQPRWLAPGTYTVVASGAQLREARVEREVVPGVLTDLHLRLQPIHRILLYVTANPTFAEVFVDGESAGTPRRRYGEVFIDGRTGTERYAWGRELPVGRHRISVRAAGHVSFDTTVVVAGASKDVRFSVRLREEGRRP